MKHNQKVFKCLLEHTPIEEQLFRPNEKSWCLLEVACHLLDEEVEDFRNRVNYVLNVSHLPLISISPHLWPLERSYLQQDFHATLKEFLSERKKSIIWLNSLQNPEWAQTVDHPEVGPRSAKKFLINWLAHDYHHIRQINSIHHAYLKSISGDDLTYAGKW